MKTHELLGGFFFFFGFLLFFKETGIAVYYIYYRHTPDVIHCTSKGI